jgi:uncharacterized membrane protein
MPGPLDAAASPNAIAQTARSSSWHRKCFRDNRIVRFHAFQGLYLFVAYLIEDWVLKPMFSVVPHVHVNAIVQFVLLGMSVFMIIKASQGEAFSLPIIGELAEKSVSER